VVKRVWLPAVALLVNDIIPVLPEPSTAATKFWVIPELLVMPTPLRVSINVGASVMVKALAPESNTMLSTCVDAESETPVMVEVAKVATSAAPFGIVPPVQLPAVFQSPVPGLASHVALWAMTGLLESDRSSSAPQRVWVKAASGEVGRFIMRMALNGATRWMLGKRRLLEMPTRWAMGEF
jgi:hypothetical protein